MSDTLTLRRPVVTDGAAVWQLVADAGTLDRNSPYAYLMACDHFADTCVVADASRPGRSGDAIDDEALAGAVVAYRKPAEPTTLFVWQIGVAADARGRGLGLQMLRWLVDATGVDHLEASVTPDNEASRRLFTALARSYDADCAVTDWLTASDFPEAGHDAEQRFRIGPFDPRRRSRDDTS